MTPWWAGALTYQVYPRSFRDADGDGVGDLAGVRERLDHVVHLGADAIWLTPFQRSPQADHGYDVSDYCDVDPLFGTLADFEALLADAHAAGLRVIVDLVPNHCSDAHPAFRAALAAGPGSPERARFHFAPGRGAAGDEPPNDWPSVFGGPAWTRVVEPDGRPGEWYLHLYAPEQPDWNWRDPRTPEMFFDVLRFWLDRGVDGIRIDVAHGLFKAAGLPDLCRTDIEPMRLRGNPLACDQEEVHEVYRSWRRLADAYPGERVLVGEVNLGAVRSARYLRPDELHQAFAFAFLAAPWFAHAWRTAVEELLAGAVDSGSPVTWVVENHDVARTVTRYGGGRRGAARARAALLTVLGLPGSAYLYQGQELGLPEVDVPPGARQDPAWARSGFTRDGCRVPVPWTEDPAGAFGFSTRADARPWLPVPEGWGAYAVDAQSGVEGSSLELCREALRLRGSLHADGTIAWDDTAEVAVRGDVLLVRRADALLLAVNMGDDVAELPPGRVLLRSGSSSEGLQADEAVWVAVR